MIIWNYKSLSWYFVVSGVNIALNLRFQKNDIPDRQAGLASWEVHGHGPLCHSQCATVYVYYLNKNVYCVE